MCKKIFLLLVVSISFTHLLVAQQYTDSLKTHKRSYVSLGLGVSRGIGKFGQSESVNQRDGFALTGLNIQLERVVFGSHNAGFGLTAGRFTNALDGDMYVSGFSGNAKISDAKPWRTLYLMTGPYITIPTRYIDIDFKCVGGFLFVKRPSFTLTYPDQSHSYYTSSSSKASFGLNMGSNIRLRMSDKTQFKIGIDYITSTANIKDDNSSFKQKLNVFNVSWGLVFLMN